MLLILFQILEEGAFLHHFRTLFMAM
jgi:hypothetical protein